MGPCDKGGPKGLGDYCLGALICSGRSFPSRYSSEIRVDLGTNKACKPLTILYRVRKTGVCFKVVHNHVRKITLRELIKGRDNCTPSLIITQPPRIFAQPLCILALQLPHWGSMQT